MNESKEFNDARTLETVRVCLDEMLDRVVAESNRIEPLRSLAQRVLNDLVTQATDGQESGAGDVDSLRERIHNQTVNGNTQRRHIIEGQTNRNVDERNFFDNSEHYVSHCNSSRSLPKCFVSNSQEPTALKPSPSCKSLPVTTRSSTQVLHDSDSMASSQTSCHSDEASNSIDASNLTEEIDNPKYKMVKIVKTPLGVIKVHCNGDIDDKELDRIISESKKILNTRKQNDANTKSGNDKQKGLFSRVSKFFRRICCCSVQTED